MPCHPAAAACGLRLPGSRGLPANPKTCKSLPPAGALRGEIGGLRPLDPSQGSLGQSKDNLAQTVNKPSQNRLVQSKNAHSGEICKGKGELETEGLQSGEYDGCDLMFEVAGVEAGVAHHLHAFGRNVGNQEREEIQAEQVTVLWVIIERSFMIKNLTPLL